MARELSKVLDFVESLRALAPSEAGHASFAPPGAPLRDDQVNGRRLDPDTATAMAPEAEEGFFLVPPIVENLEP